MTFRIGTLVLASAFASACGSANPVPDDANVVADAAIASDAGGEVASDVGADAPRQTRYQNAVSVGTLEGVPETSGIVASRAYPGVFWVHNDSGNDAELIAIDATANVLETMRVDGATNTDWEDIALYQDEALGDLVYIGDIGDNLARESMGERSSRGGVMRIYRVVEPDPRASLTRVAADSFEVRYPARPYDCEAMFADPATGDLYFVTKEEMADVFVARAPFVAGATTTLEHVTSFALASVTAADISNDGARVVVRSYGTIRVFDLGSTEPRFAGAFMTPIASPSFGSLAEAICFSADGYDLYTVSEGDGAHLFHIAWE